MNIEYSVCKRFVRSRVIQERREKRRVTARKSRQGAGRSRSGRTDRHLDRDRKESGTPSIGEGWREEKDGADLKMNGVVIDLSKPNVSLQITSVSIRILCSYLLSIPTKYIFYVFQLVIMISSENVSWYKSCCIAGSIGRGRWSVPGTIASESFVAG